MNKRHIKILWFVTSLIPAPFFFHFYEYGQYVKREEATYLLLACIVFIIIIGILSSTVKIRYVLLINVITAVISLVLAMNFITEDGGWFKPFGRDIVILLTAIPFFIGQVLVRMIAKPIFIREKKRHA
ncbi:hypothetical protein CSV69_09945 [Sporosarcina sp. P26b]|uniref:hypothetical protein n=1 Tax=Sporosarcina sp. P26b TaxID=2048253 RepID=UPI000C164302|nr:hypothetical protein [Sporosarcina sp. P26b]PIC95833.1 hypothetical protein CSV69_09945 [Sporosarcina sp. P26b]